MRCLYCGEPLSLLRKLTGKAEFCSEAHRVAYQDEFNTLALQRLASQPKMVRRPEPQHSFVPPPEPVQPVVALQDDFEEEVDEPFAGLPFPEDPDDYDLGFESELVVTPVAAPVVDFGPPPPPMWGLLGESTLTAAGQTPPSYGFPLGLEDYPRECLMPNGVFRNRMVGAVPFSGYVGLPEFLDDDAVDAALPLNLGSDIALVIPLYDLLTLHVSEPPFESRLSELSADLGEGFTESAFAPATATLALPAYRRPAPSAITRLALDRHPLQPLMASPFPWDDGAARVGDYPQSALEPERHPWPSAAVSSCPPAVVPPSRELERSAPLAEEAFAAASVAELSAGIPDCESFESERILVVPHFPVALETGVPPAGLVELDLALDSATPARVSATELSFAPQVCRIPSLAAAASHSPVPCDSLFADDPIAVPASDIEGSQPNLPWTSPVPVPATTVSSPPQRELALAANAVIAGHAVSLPEFESSAPASAIFTPAMARTPYANAPLRSALPAVDLLAGLPFQLLAIPPVDEELEVVLEPEPEPEPEAAAWMYSAPRLMSPTCAHQRTATASALAKVRVKDFGWPEFAAGCDSLFTPDQPFQFHELPFPQRGITDSQVGSALKCDLMQGLALDFVDDRFDGILHPSFEAAKLNEWLDEAGGRPGEWPDTKPSKSAPPPVEAPLRPIPVVAAAPVAEPPASWQQAARAMYEGEQQVPREPLPLPRISALPPREAKSVIGVPVIPEPFTGMELTRAPYAEPPIPYVRPHPPGHSHQDRSPANDAPGFEWRREQPEQAPPSSGHGGSTVSVNTTIVVEGNADGLVVESAVRVSLGGGTKKKKGDAIEKFTEGEDLEESRVQIVPPEDLPAFSGPPAELRALLQHIPPIEDSVQWPKFSVTPMRRRIAFGPAAGATKGSLFGGSNGAAAAKPPLPEAKPLPPKKSVGFLFKKLTNS